MKTQQELEQRARYLASKDKIVLTETMPYYLSTNKTVRWYYDLACQEQEDDSPH